MVHIPIRGLFLLTRVAAIAMAAVAVPVIVKQAKPLAKKLGEEFEKFGKWLKEDEVDQKSAKAEAKAEPAKTTAKPAEGAASNPKAAKKPAVKTTAKKPAVKKAPAKAKAKPKVKKAV